MDEKEETRQRVYDLMELETHSGQYLPVDIFETTNTGQKHNYLGKYKPEEFWRLYGKVYRNLFRSPEDVAEETENPGDRMDLNAKDIVSRVAGLEHDSILEVGCGFGRCLLYVHANCQPIKRLEGIDISETMVADARKFLDNYEKGNEINVLHGDARNLPFKDKEFDLVYTHVCLTHIPPKFIDQVTGEISRVARKFIIHVERFHYQYEHPNPHRWSHLLPPFYLKRGWELLEYDKLGKNPEHHTKIMVFKR